MLGRLDVAAHSIPEDLLDEEAPKGPPPSAAFTPPMDLDLPSSVSQNIVGPTHCPILVFYFIGLNT